MSRTRIERSSATLTSDRGVGSAAAPLSADRRGGPPAHPATASPRHAGPHTRSTGSVQAPNHGPSRGRWLRRWVCCTRDSGRPDPRPRRAPYPGPQGTRSRTRCGGFLAGRSSLARLGAVGLAGAPDDKRDLGATLLELVGGGEHGVGRGCGPLLPQFDRRADVLAQVVGSGAGPGDELQVLVAGNPLHHDRFKAGRGDQGRGEPVLVPTLNPTLLVLLASRVQIEQPAIDPAWNLGEPKGNSGPFGFVEQLVEPLLELGGDRPAVLPLVLAFLDRDPLLQLVDLIEEIGVERHPNRVGAGLPEGLDLLPGGRVRREPLGHVCSPGSWWGRRPG